MSAPAHPASAGLLRVGAGTTAGAAVRDDFDDKELTSVVRNRHLPVY